MFYEESFEIMVLRIFYIGYESLWFHLALIYPAHFEDVPCQSGVKSHCWRLGKLCI